MSDDLTFRTFQEASRRRSAHWHSRGEEWNAADWSNATMGEIGEVAEVFALMVAAFGQGANTVKKIRRHETGTTIFDAPVEELRDKLAGEIADGISYAVLLADYFDIDVAHVMALTFNKVNVRLGYDKEWL